MAYVTIENNKITGIFSQEQIHLKGYVEIDDNDKRIGEFLAKQEAALNPKIPTIADLQNQLNIISAQLASMTK